MKVRNKILYLVSEDSFFVSHFIERARAARLAGYKVVVCASEGKMAQSIRGEGFHFIRLNLKRGSANPLRELKTLVAIARILSRERPTLVHNVSLKLVIYGSAAARLIGGLRVVNAPIGMGYVYTSNSLKARLLRPVVSLALRVLANPPGSRVIFENEDDLGAFVREGRVRREDAKLIRGAGVDLDAFHPTVRKASVTVVVMVARMLKDKGVSEFVEAARILRRQGVVARFLLVGSPDPQNPTTLSEAQLLQWSHDGDVEWLGHREDIAEILGSSDIACLPSYREGLPKSLLEAMASGLPIVATDVVGCREVVEKGVSGLLVPPRDALALAGSLNLLIRDEQLRRSMGEAGRRRAELMFGTRRVVDETLAVYRELAGL